MRACVSQPRCWKKSGKFAVMAFIPSPLTDLSARLGRVGLLALEVFTSFTGQNEALSRRPSANSSACRISIPRPTAARCRRLVGRGAIPLPTCPYAARRRRVDLTAQISVFPHAVGSSRPYRRDRAPVLSFPASLRDEPLSSKTRRESSARYPASLSRCYALVFVYRISCAPCSGAVVSSRRRRGA
ncbi:hypothetical protein BJ912DRAFT_1064728 [Pholiota molesta]|nr:hypothetical protein BJ912DRAFT_1064728 [Pholiota molesta]